MNERKDRLSEIVRANQLHDSWRSETMLCCQGLAGPFDNGRYSEKQAYLRKREPSIEWKEENRDD